MRKVTTLTGKNLPKPGWPDSQYVNQLYTPSEDEVQRQREIATALRPWNEIFDFTRVCDQTGLSEKLRKD